eukprot:1184136-Prorocentrum_minimum.AAC.4
MNGWWRGLAHPSNTPTWPRRAVGLHTDIKPLIRPFTTGEFICLPSFSQAPKSTRVAWKALQTLLGSEWGGGNAKLPSRARHGHMAPGGNAFKVLVKGTVADGWHVCTAGLLAKSMIHPLDVVKKRFQVAGLQRSARYGPPIPACPLEVFRGRLAVIS